MMSAHSGPPDTKKGKAAPAAKLQSLGGMRRMLSSRSELSGNPMFGKEVSTNFVSAWTVKHPCEPWLRRENPACGVSCICVTGKISTAPKCLAWPSALTSKLVAIQSGEEGACQTSGQSEAPRDGLEENELDTAAWHVGIRLQLQRPRHVPSKEATWPGRRSRRCALGKAQQCK